MLRQMTQVRKLIYVFFLSLGFLAVCVPASAQNVHDMERKASSPDGVHGGEPVSFESVVDGVSNLFDDIGNFFKEKGADTKKTENKESGKEDEADQQKLIHAKKMGSPNSDPHSVGAQENKTAPYQVYSAPMIPQETSFAQEPVAANWHDVDLDKVPPLSNKEGLGIGTEDGAKVLPNVQKSRKVVKRVPLPSIKAMPQQFLPILPLDQNSKSEAQLLPVASNYNLAANHHSIKRAIIVIHGITRNASESLATVESLAGPNASQALIIAPQFPVSVDIMRFSKYLPDSGRQVARWSLDLGWQYGGLSRLSPHKRGISSFTALDILMMFLADKQRFPALEHIVIAGHGLGGDFVQRYAAVGVAPPMMVGQDLSLRFLVANPSTYLYPTASRPIKGSLRFERPQESHCAAYDEYPYGLQKLSPYVRRKGVSSIRLEYPLVPMTYLVGGKFVVDHYLDRSCAALMQGKNRSERGINFSRYLSRSYGNAMHPHQTFMTVPNVGYDIVGVFGSFCGMISLFSDGVCLQ